MAHEYNSHSAYSHTQITVFSSVLKSPGLMLSGASQLITRSTRHRRICDKFTMWLEDGHKRAGRPNCSMLQKTTKKCKCRNVNQPSRTKIGLAIISKNDVEAADTILILTLCQSITNWHCVASRMNFSSKLGSRVVCRQERRSQILMGKWNKKKKEEQSINRLADYDVWPVD